MSDLYPTLLRNIETPIYGATLQNIVTLGDKRSKEMDAKRLVIIVDGDEYDPIECTSLDIQICGETTTITVCTIATSKDTKRNDKINAPTPDGFLLQEHPDIFTFQGEDLEAFLELSEFRIDKNKTVIFSNQIPSAVSIESDTYDIQDITSVQSASLELIDKERKLLEDGFKVVQVNTPRYNYENANNFKLVETAVLYKIDARSEDNNAKT